MMNNCISKIHFTNSTGVSLNERFTAMSKVSGAGMGVSMFDLDRPRVRSSSVPRMDTNRQLVEQWDRSKAAKNIVHLHTAPLRRPSRIQRNNIAQQIKRTMAKLAGGLQHLRSSNSLSDIATMNADRMLMQRALGNTPSIASRLGNAGQTRRGRSVSRGRSGSRTRSTSRGRQPSLTRTNSRTDLRRSASRERLPRADSRNNLSRVGARINLTRAGSRTNLSLAGTRNQLNAIPKAVAPNDARRRLNRNTTALMAKQAAGTNGAVNRSRSRSRSRVRAAAAAAVASINNTVGRGRGRPRKRASSQARNARSGSVNSRLGTNRTNDLVATAVTRRTAAARGGRVNKRSNSRGRGGLQNATPVALRPGRPLKRETTTTRKGAGGKAQQQNKNKAANGGGSATVASTRQGRSRSRRASSRIRGRGASTNRTTLTKKEPKSREQLDSELDQYMANTRSLDNEMAEYINGQSRM